MSKNLKFNLIGIALAFIAGAILVYVFENRTEISETISGSANKELRENGSKYKFIKPLLSSEQIDEDLKWFPAERDMKASLQEEVAKYPDIKIGLHFVNLKNSGWFGVNGSESFIPASLLKLPLYASYLKLREEGKVSFDDVIDFQGGADYNKIQNLGTGKIQAGNSYTVQQLLTAMIVESDNNALELLYQYKQDSLKDIFESLQIEIPDDRKEIAMNDFVTPRGMARFLLVLYNSSYLHREDSEEALELLSKTTFKDGLVAGVPEGIKVSHKFGEREVAGADGFKELHDCGIIYHSKTPYILCVMTKGNDFDKQKAAIKAISSVVYSNIDTFAVAIRK